MKTSNVLSSISDRLLTASLGFIFMSLFSGTYAMSQVIPTLKLNQPIKGTLEGGQAQTFQIPLKANQFVRIVVKQHGVDVVLSLFAGGTWGWPMGKRDLPTGTHGEESLSIVIGGSGVYVVEVKPLSEQAGRGAFEIELEAQREATEQDKKRVKVEKSFQEAGDSIQIGLDGRKAAAKKYEEFLPLWREMGDSYMEGLTWDILANLFEASYELDKAVEAETKAVMIYRAIKDRDSEGYSLFHLATMFRQRGSYSQALDAYEESLRARPIFEDKEREIEALTEGAEMASSLGATYNRNGEHKKAIESYQRAVPLYRMMENKSAEAESLYLIGKTYRALGHKRSASGYFKRALMLLKGAKDYAGERRLRQNIGLLVERLPLQANLIVQTGHPYSVYSIAYSPDGKILASGGSEGMINLWDAGSGKMLRTLSGHANSISAIAFSSDGKTLVSGSYDSTVKLWDVESGIEVRTLMSRRNVSKIQFPDPVNSVAVSTDGKTIVSIYLGRVVLWDVESGKELQIQSEKSASSTQMVISPDGKTVAGIDFVKITQITDVFNGKENKMLLWDAETGKVLRIFPGATGRVPVAFSRDGRILAAIEPQDKTITLWDVNSGTKLGTLQGNGNDYALAAFSRDGKRLAATARGSNKIMLWDVAGDGKPKILYRESAAALQISPYVLSIPSLDFSSDGKTLTSASSIEGVITLWDVESGQVQRRFSGKALPVGAVAFSPDKKILASRYSDNTIRLWDVESGKEFRTLTGHSSAVGPIAFSPDGKTLASGSDDKTIKLWDVESGREKQMFGGLSIVVRSLVFSPNGEVIAGGSNNDSITLWDVKSGKEIRTFSTGSSNILSAHGGPPRVAPVYAGALPSAHLEDVTTPIAFSPDSSTVVSRSNYTLVKFWDVKTGRVLRTLTGPISDILSIAYSPDGRFVASGDSNQTLKLWDAKTGKELNTLIGYEGRARSITFSPDGSTLAFGSTDNAIKLWDMNNRIGEPRVFKGHSSGIGDIEFSSDGMLITSMAADAKIKLWNALTGKELCSLIMLDKKDWVVVTTEGRFDTNKIDDSEGLHWIVSDDPLKSISLEIFMRDYYEPKLLSRVLRCNANGNCGKEFPALPNLTELNRIQPLVNIIAVSQPDANRRVKVTVTVGKGVIPVTECRMKKCETGAYDLRLFRDGQLVGNFPDRAQQELSREREVETNNASEKKNRWREVTRINLDSGTGTKTVTFDIQLPKIKNAADVDFAAYAFNEDRVKSATAHWRWADEVKAVLPKAEKVTRRAFIISVGVNASENENWRLQFAANDARAMQRILADKLRVVGEYEVVSISLVSDYDAAGTLAPNDATKNKIEMVFALLAGKKLSDEQRMLLDEIRENAPDVVKLLHTKATPDDMVIISFSSHGYADNRGNFYLLPYNIGKESQQMKDAIHLAISSNELSLWMKDVDGGDMAMIIDACHAAASVESGEFKPGPMGSRGLGQLAYDKNMKVLTATKALDVALEVGGKLNQGLLSFALLRDGLETSQADFKPQPDGKIFLGEWLEYGETRVPQLYAELRSGRIKGITSKRSEPLAKVLKKRDGYQQTPSLFNFSKQGKDVLISTTTSRAGDFK